jgi:hypothetical protein
VRQTQVARTPAEGEQFASEWRAATLLRLCLTETRADQYARLTSEATVLALGRRGGLGDAAEAPELRQHQGDPAEDYRTHTFFRLVRQDAVIRH